MAKDRDREEQLEVRRRMLVSGKNYTTELRLYRAEKKLEANLKSQKLDLSIVNGKIHLTDWVDVPA